MRIGKTLGVLAAMVTLIFAVKAVRAEDVLDEVTKMFIYPKGQVIKTVENTVNLVSGKTTIILSADSVARIKEWYQKNMPARGWVPVPVDPTAVSGPEREKLQAFVGRLAFNKQGKVGTVTIMPDEETGQTLIFIQIKDGAAPPKTKITAEELKRQVGVPIYPGVVEAIIVEDHSYGGTRHTVMYDISATREQVITYYRQQLLPLKWTEADLPLTGEEGETVSPTFVFCREEETLLIHLEPQSLSKNTSVLLIYQQPSDSVIN